MLCFARCDELFHGVGDVLDRNVRIDPRLMEQVNVIRSQSFKHCVDNLSNVLGPTIKTVPRAVGVDPPTEFRGNDDLVGPTLLEISLSMP